MTRVKKININLAGEVRAGDLVAMKRTYESGTTEIITGVAEKFTTYAGVSLMLRLERNVQLAIKQTAVMYARSSGNADEEIHVEFLYAVREVNEPELPTDICSLIWSYEEGRPTKRMLVVDEENQANSWRGVTSFRHPSRINMWQPLTAETFDKPDDSAWIDEQVYRGEW